MHCVQKREREREKKRHALCTPLTYKSTGFFFSTHFHSSLVSDVLHSPPSIDVNEEQHCHTPVPSYDDPFNSMLLDQKLTVSTDIRDAHDAHVVLEAVRLNMLPLIKRRLLASEREDLRSGHVYVWEEAQDEGGLLRWTDGRRW